MKNSNINLKDVNNVLIGKNKINGNILIESANVAIYENELINEQNLEEARKIQYDINSIIYKLCSGHGNMYAMIKEVLRIKDSLDIGGVREPLTNLISSDIPIAREAADMIKNAIEKYCH